MKKLMFQTLSALLCVAIMSISFPQNSLAVGSSGLSIQFNGVKALGQANAFVAQADDPSANYFNPAGLTQLPGWQTTLGATGVSFDTTYKGQGITQSMEDDFSTIPHFFLSGALPSGNDVKNKWAVGFGLTSPFGLATEWSKTGFSKYVATESNLETLNYNPNVSYSPNQNFSFGAGVDYLSLREIKLANQIDQSAVGGADGTQELKGDGGQWGYNLGVLWKPLQKHSFGAAYRSQVKIHVKGNINLSGLDPLVQGAYNFPSADYSTPAETDMAFPQSLILGYYYVPSPKWTLLFDYEWTDWSVNKKTQLDIKESDPSRNAFFNLSPNPTPREWKDVHAFAIGSQYNFKNGIALRSGYSYITTAVPNKTWDPSLPDSNQHTIATGIGYSWKDLTLDAAYNIILFNNRNVDNTVGQGAINGKYETLVNVFGLGLTYKFAQPK